MHNVVLPKSLDTDLNTAGSEVELNRLEQPLLRKALSDNFGKSLHNDNDDEEELDGIGELIQQTTEERPKIKTRSRFSSAFRSFRVAKSLKKKSATSVPVDTVLLSGGEDLEAVSSDFTEVKKKKTKLSKKFSLSGIKRNKVNPKKEDIQTSSLQLVSSATQTTQTLDRRSIFSADDESKRKVTVTTSNPPSRPTPTPPTPESSPTKFDKVRKIQITIQGKKIEHTNNKNSGHQGRKNLPATTTEITTSTTASTATIDDVDYLTAAEDTAQQKYTSNTFRRNSKKKLKSKSKSSSPPTPTKSLQETSQSISSTISTTTTTEEQLVITQSICDTPPRERAPAKPSRTPGPAPPCTYSATSGGAIRKSLSQQIPKLRRQRLHVVDSSENESNFMIREGTVERGRRFPRPSSIDSQDLPSLVVAQSQSLPTPLGVPDSLLPSRPTSAEVEVKSLPPFIEETPKEPQDTADRPREPISLPTLTPTIVPTLEIEKPPTPSTSPTTNTTVSSEHIPTINTELFTGNNIQNPNLSGSIKDQSLGDNDNNTIDDPASVCEQQSIRFSLGTPVRPQRTSVLLSQVTFDSKDFSSITSQKSSGSDQTPPSESSNHRRKIQYIDQSSIYTDEERAILDGNHEAYNYYLSGISEYSFDSEFSGETPMPAFGDLTMDQEDPPIMTSSTEKREHLYKILVIGELGTGKTSFIKRYVHQFFSQNYRATIGVDFALKVLHWDSNTIVRLQLWDIAGQERFGNMTRVYYKEAVGAFIVFDVTRSGTFDCVSKWKEDLDSKVQLPDGSPIPCILLANKCDQDKQGIVTTPEKMDEYVRENGFAGWFETSAKENINIDEAARALVNKILLNDKLISAADIADSEKFNLANTNGGQTTTQAIKSKCSC